MMTRRTISLETKRELDAMFLPELHQARWAERLGRLREDKRAAALASPAAAKAVEAEIAEHYKHRHDIARTRRWVETEYAKKETA